MYFLTYVLYCMGDYVPALTSEFLVRALLYQPSFKIKILRAVYDAYSPIIRGVPTYGMCCISCTASHRYDGMTV